jgi:putative tryptophan/tyrosine transport system substrate-binding protein
MERRRFVIGGFATLAAQVGAGTLAAAELRRVGILADTPGPHWQIFRQGLSQSGHLEGKTIALEWRWAEGQVKRFPGLAGELVREKVDIIVAEGTPAIRAAKAATSKIPIVMAIAADPVGSGFVQSLTRPGGNVTGSSSRSPELYAKQMQLLQEVIPGLSRVAVLWHPANRPALKEVEEAAHLLKLQLHLFEAREAGEVSAAFSALNAQRPQALIVMATPTFDGLQARLAQLATDAKLAAVYNKSQFSQAGGLFSYGARYGDFFRRAAEYVDKILRGAKPADLPVEQATAFELVINLKTAKALGVTVPLPLRVRADQVIE